jgi:hypothetical protein
VADAEAGVKGDVSSANEQQGGRYRDETNGYGGAVFQELVADDGVQKEDPGGGGDGGDVECGETLRALALSFTNG